MRLELAWHLGDELLHLGAVAHVAAVGVDADAHRGDGGFGEQRRSRARPGRAGRRNRTPHGSPAGRTPARSRGPARWRRPVTIATLPRNPSADQGLGLRAAPARHRTRRTRARVATRAGSKPGWRHGMEGEGTGRTGDWSNRRQPRRTFDSMNRMRLDSACSLVGAAAWGVIALHRGETISAAWLVLAAVCTYLVAYRFYAAFIAAKVFGARRPAGPRRPSGSTTAATSCRPTRGSSSATTSPPSPAPGPLVGPVLAAQFGYLPGTLWIIVGVVLGGAVQDFVILFGSMRRDGKSLGQMAKEEIGPVAGVARDGRGAGDHDHPARGAGAGGGQRAQGQPLGHRSRSPARSRSRCSWASTCSCCGPARRVEATVGGRRAAASLAPGRRALGGRVADAGAAVHLTAGRRSPGAIMVYGFVAQRAAGVAAARAARLPLGLREDRHRRRCWRSAS